MAVQNEVLSERDEMLDGYSHDNTSGRSALSEQQADDRRRARRKSVFLRASIYPIDVFCDARIRNFSAAGLMGETAVELAIGQTVHITKDEQTYHAGQIKWSQDQQFGLALGDAVTVFDSLAYAKDHGSREGHHPRSTRIAIDETVRLIAGRPPRPAIIRNVSPGGILLDTAPGLKPGQHIVVRVGNAGPIYGRAQWIDGVLIGFKAQNTISGFTFACAGD